MSISEVQALNTVGIDLMEQGNLNEAAAAFSDALSQLSWCLLLPAPIGQQQDSRSSQPQAAATADCCEEEEQQQDIDVYCFEENSLDARRDDFFSHAFHFECSIFPPDHQEQQGEPCSPSLLSSQPPQQQFLTSAQHCAATVCCLFNLALCHYLEWKRNNKVHTSHIISAVQLYEQAISMASAAGNYMNTFALHAARSGRCVEQVHQEPPMTRILSVLMAVATNATFCSRELGNCDNVGYWNHLLWKMLSLRSSSFSFGESGCGGVVEDEKQAGLQFFTTNALLNSFPSTAAHAA